MKKFFIILSLLACLSAGNAASAQTCWIWDRNPQRITKHQNNSPYSIRVGYAGYPDVIGDRFTYGYYHIGYYDMVADRETTIAEIYQDYNDTVYGTGMFTGEFIWNAGRVFNFSGTFGLCPMWTQKYNGMTEEKACTNFGLAMVVFPELKLMYCNTPTVRVYSAAGIGFGLYPGFKKTEGAFVEGEIIPIGLEIGRRWYGFGEIGVGTLFMGGQFGVGYRFSSRRAGR